MDELEVRRTLELYRSMIASETNQRRKIVLSELIGQEERKLHAIGMTYRTGQDW
jgi:hypothetical protein